MQNKTYYLRIVGERTDLYVTVFIRHGCGTDKELDLANTFLFTMIYWPPSNIFILNKFRVFFSISIFRSNITFSEVKWRKFNTGRTAKGIFTGLSVKEAIEIVDFP